MACNALSQNKARGKRFLKCDPISLCIKNTIYGCASADSGKNWNIVYDIVMAMLLVPFFKIIKNCMVCVCIQ